MGASNRSKTKMPGVSSYYDINRRFRVTRKEAGLTQEEMAEELRITIDLVKQIETCRVVPNIYVLRRWRSVFRRSYDWIMEGKK